MRIKVQHTTSYSYAVATHFSLQSLRLTPASFEGHQVVSWDIALEPAASLLASVDGFGNVVHLATINKPHQSVVITATGVVDVENRNGVVSGAPGTTPLRVFLRRTPLTEPTGAIAALAEGAAEPDRIVRLHALMQRIRDRIDYVPGTTAATTTAGEALEAGAGVCQDHAHVFIAAARQARVPARYVTGYLLLDGDDESMAHHAWAEAWVDGLGWVGFDVANNVCPTERYVRLAVGLDAASASPIRGTRRGAQGDDRLDVVVHVAEAAGGQQ